MALFNNSRLTNSAIFYNRGVPQDQRYFALLTTLNYSSLRLLAIHNKRQGRPVYSLFQS
jgi:hypothetical protein